jgi:hypothetical protein
LLFMLEPIILKNANTKVRYRPPKSEIRLIIV